MAKRKQKTRKRDVLKALFIWLIYAILEALTWWLSADKAPLFEETKLKSEKAYFAIIFAGTTILILIGFAFLSIIKAYLHG
ncbi:MAG: hypothetical protein QXP36_02930 [Conexivisphaerales archaeon]